MSIQRYALEHERGESNTFGCPDGDYVLHSDYAALEARCAGLDREIEGARSSLDKACKEYRELSNTLDAARTNWLRATEERDALQAKLDEIEARSDDEAVFGDHNLIPHYKAKLAAAEEALRECQILFRNIHDYGAMRHQEDWKKVENVWDIVNITLANHIADTSKKVQTAPTDREKRLETALRDIRDKHAMDNEGAGSFISQVNELEDIARAALADTTTDEVQP